MKKVMSLLLLLTMSLSIVSCGSSSSADDSSSESMDTSSVDGQVMESSETAEDAETEDNTYVEISWDDLCAGVYSVDVTADNYEEYIDYGIVSVDGEDEWCFYLKDAMKCTSLYVNGSYVVTRKDIIYDKETNEIISETSEIDHSRGNTFSDFVESIDGIWHLKLCGVSYEEEWPDYNDPETNEPRPAVYTVEYEVTDINVTEVGGQICVCDIDESCWNDTDDLHKLGSSSYFLYSQTPDGYDVFLYDTGGYDVVLGEVTKAHMGYDWWDYVSPTSKIVDDGDLAAE